MGVSNNEFARAVGCHFTLSSRLRNGHRRPSVEMLNRIKKAYDLDADEMLSAYEAGTQEFAEYLRKNIFEATDAA
jgi:transcriptional regulator with XRE-family HTH domain